MKLNALDAYLSELLTPSQFNDYCPNGLQVEGRGEVNKIVTGVTASLALIEAAIAYDADAILVHHGYFWKGESQPVTGIKKKRLQALLKNNISLFAYHLPLDAHPTLGNNIMLGKVLGIPITRWLDKQQNMLAVADLDRPMTIDAITEQVSQALGRTPQVLAGSKQTVQSVAWCTGAAQSMMAQVVDADIDLFITGEISEQTYHIVQETNTAFMAAGHHATERYGIQALGEHLAETQGLTHIFVDIDNPI